MVKREFLASRLKNGAEGDLNNPVFLEVTAESAWHDEFAAWKVRSNTGSDGVDVHWGIRPIKDFVLLRTLLAGSLGTSGSLGSDEERPQNGREFAKWTRVLGVL